MGRKRRNKNRRGGGNNQSNKLAYLGPPGADTAPVRIPSMPPHYRSNLCVRKVFRFVLSSAVAEGGVSSISSAKLCALLCVGVTSTTVYQLFEQVRIRKISLWSSVQQTTGLYLPRTVSIEMSGVGNGQQGSALKDCDMSVGATRVARACIKPRTNMQGAQWQNGNVTTPPLLFTLIAGGGSVCDIELDVVFTGDARVGQVSVTGPATVGQVYWLALDNNAGGNLSSSNTWSPMPDLLTVT